MFGLLDALTDVVVNTTKIVATPVEIAARIINVPLEETAKALEEVAEDLK